MTEFIIEEFSWTEPAIPVQRLDGSKSFPVPATACHAFRVGEYRDGQLLRHHGQCVTISEAAAVVRGLRHLAEREAVAQPVPRVA